MAAHACNAGTQKAEPESGKPALVYTVSSGPAQANSETITKKPLSQLSWA